MATMTDSELATERARVKARYMDVLVTLQAKYLKGRNEVLTPIKITTRHLVGLRGVTPFTMGGSQDIDELDEAQLAILAEAIETHFGGICPVKQTSAA